MRNFIPSVRLESNTLIRPRILRNHVSVVFLRFFRGPHREGRAPPYAEKFRFRRAGIKKAHAVILCCINNQTVHRRTAWACKEHIITFPKRKEPQLWHWPEKASLAPASRGTAESLKRLFPGNFPDSFLSVSLWKHAVKGMKQLLLIPGTGDNVQNFSHIFLGARPVKVSSAWNPAIMGGFRAPTVRMFTLVSGN